jgi:putative cardiolipin synthase
MPPQRGSVSLPVVLAALLLAFLGGCASLPPGTEFPRIESSALEHPGETRLGQTFEAAARQHGGKSGFRLQPVGIDGFLARMQMTEAAERTIDVQYFIFQEDDTGKLLTDAILRAADRGVRVRVLLDDVDVSGRDRQIITLGGHPRIEIRLFNPFAYRGSNPLLRAIEFALDSPRLNRRMHNKLLVVDNAVAILGGRNIGDEYFQTAPRDVEFGDYDVFAAGPIVRKLSETFDAYWNSAIAIPLAAFARDNSAAAWLAEYRAELEEHRRRMQDTDYVRQLATGQPFAGMLSGTVPLVWSEAQVVCDPPEKAIAEDGDATSRPYRSALAQAAAALQSELLLVTPYLVPGKRGLERLRELRSRNVRVRVLTNSFESTDVQFVHAGYVNYRRPLLEYGVELYEVRAIPGEPRASGGPLQSAGSGRFALHAKVFVFDRRRLYIGSMNVDRRSMRLNTELGLIIDSPELARQVVARFESIARPANSYVVALREDRAGGPARLTWQTEQDGRLIEHDREPRQTAWQAMMIDILSALPLEEHL